jgi:hypothetical protein
MTVKVTLVAGDLSWEETLNMFYTAHEWAIDHCESFRRSQASHPLSMWAHTYSFNSEKDALLFTLRWRGKDS